MTSFVSRRAVTGGLLLTPALLAASSPAFADAVLDARHTLDEAAITVERVRDEMKGSAMDDLMARSKGILIIPSYYKAGFLIGGAYGDGVLVSRLPGGTGFGDPAFYRMTSGSIGLQIGMQSAEIVFMILTEKGLSSVLDDEFKLGANVGMSIGTLGVGAEADTTTHVGKDIIAYSKAAGLFAGGALEGAVIKPRKDWNAAVYGVDNDNPSAIVQRDQLRTASALKDTLAKVEPAQAPASETPPPASN